MDAPSDPKPTFEKIDNVMLRMKETDRRFVCGCGTNVFTQTGPTHYVCNGCRADYEGTS